MRSSLLEDPRVLGSFEPAMLAPPSRAEPLDLLPYPTLEELEVAAQHPMMRPAGPDWLRDLVIAARGWGDGMERACAGVGLLLIGYVFVRGLIALLAAWL